MQIRRDTMLLALFAATMTLTACQQETPAAQEEQDTGEAAGPEGKPGIAVTDARMVLPIVSGRPGAAYFSVANTSADPVSIAGIFVEGAQTAEIHETTGGSMAKLDSAAIEPGTTVTFAPGGKHVMLFDIDESLGAGGTTEMTITFSDGDKLSLPVAIIARGGNDAAKKGSDN